VWSKPVDCLSQLFKTRNLVLELAHVEDEKELDFICQI